MILTGSGDGTGVFTSRPENIVILELIVMTQYPSFSIDPKGAHFSLCQAFSLFSSIEEQEQEATRLVAEATSVMKAGSVHSQKLLLQAARVWSRVQRSRLTLRAVLEGRLDTTAAVYAFLGVRGLPGISGRPGMVQPGSYIA